MISRHRLRIATFLVFCLSLALPATAFAIPGENQAKRAAAKAQAAQPNSQSETPDSTESTPAAETQAGDGHGSNGGGDGATGQAGGGGATGGTGGTGGTGATGGTGSTGSTGGTGAGSEGGGSGVVTPGNPGGGTPSETPAAPAAPAEPAAPASPGDESTGAGDETGDETSTGDLPAAGNDGGLGAEGADAERRSEVAQELIDDARPVNAGSGTVSDSVKRASRSSLAGVQASLVITQIVEKIPAWMRWALIALALAALISSALLAREMHRRREAEEDAMVDALTGISNRKAFERRLDLEWKRAERYGRSLGLLLLDLDGFKQVNDIHGHAAGDVVLREVAERLDQRMRDTDLVARIGGDEFAVICPETGARDLESISNHLAEAATRDLTNPVGVSIGVAEYRPGDPSMDELIDRADQAMYRVKRASAIAA